MKMYIQQQLLSQVPSGFLAAINSNDLPVCGDGTYLELTRNTYCAIVCENAYWMTLRLPAGYRWDGASIPWWARWLFGKPLLPQYRWASLWHDRLCETAQCIEDRTIADAVFLRLLKEAGVGRYRRKAMWLAVRVYGIWVWTIKGGNRAKGTCNITES